MKRLRKLELDAVRRQAQTLSDTEEEQLWLSGVLGSSTPKQLLNKVFFFAGKHFALRSGDGAPLAEGMCRQKRTNVHFDRPVVWPALRGVR